MTTFKKKKSNLAFMIADSNETIFMEVTTIMEVVSGVEEVMEESIDIQLVFKSIDIPLIFH